ncbi:MAG: hypothetical protein PQJ58_18990 [Spirochaetales bacterium]|nr:hypothetical protein [Spirochaetales bacterium]
MKYKILFILSLTLTVVQFIIPVSSVIIIPGIILVLLIRNAAGLYGFLKFLIPSQIFIVLLYLITGQFSAGLNAVRIIGGSGLCLQLYFQCYPELSLYTLLLYTGLHRKYAFILYASFNYASFIKPMIMEIQDAQRLRGIEIPKGIRSLFYLHILLIPLMVKLLKGADHLAESLMLRSIDHQ